MTDHATATAAAAARTATPAATPADRAAVYSACGWGALLVWQLLLSRTVIQTAGEAAWGLWAVIAAFKSFVLLLDGGLAQTITRDAGRAASEGAAARVRIAAAWRIGVVLAAVALLLGALLAPWAAGYLDLQGELAAVAPGLVLVHGVDAALSLLAGPLPALLRGHRWFGALAAHSVAQALLGCVLLTALVPGCGIVGAAAAVVGSRALVAVVTLFWLRRSLPPTGGLALPRGSVATMVRTVAPIWVTVAATQLSMRADVPLVGWYFGAEAAGHYDLGQQMPLAAMSLLCAILSFALPRFAADHAAADHRALARRLPPILFMACLLAGLGFGTMAFFADELLTVWVGFAPERSVTVARLYALAWASNAAVHVLVQVALAQGRFAMLTWPTIAGSLANFALSIVLAANGYADGPAWATLGTLAVLSLVVIPLLTIVRLQLPAAAIARSSLLGWATGGIAAAAIAGVVMAMAQAPGGRVLGAGVAVAIVAAVVLDLTVRRRSLLRSWLPQRD